jgi:MFS transporter, DHA1 family, inner membrane transport protein
VQPESSSQPRVPLGLLTSLKFLANLLLRLPYPFIEDIAKGLGTSEKRIGSVLGVGEFSALGGSLVGRDLDRGHFRRWAFNGLLVCGIGGVLIGVLRNQAGVIVGFCLISLGVNLATTTLHTYIGARTPFAERGRAIGFFELSWACSLLIGGYLAGRLIELTTWSAPFLVVGLALLASTPLLLRVMDADTGPVVGHADDVEGARFNWTSTTLVLAMSIVLTFSSILTFSTFGSFLNDKHGFSIGARGGIVAGIGAMELLGSGGTAVLADRLGKLNALLLGVAAMGLGSVGLITLGEGSSTATVASVLLFFFGFEFGYVSFLAVISEIGGERRGFVVALDHAVVTVARAAGAALGPLLVGASAQHFTQVQLLVLGLVVSGAVLTVALRRWTR